MKSLAFRQWVACVTTVAVLFSTTAPLGFCWCEGCHCENHISRLLPNLAVKDEKCCCIPPEPLPEEKENCCGLPEMPCSCGCGDFQKNEAVVPKAVLPIKKPKVSPSWNNVSICPANLVYVLGIFSVLSNYRTLPPPHVPLHVLLCVFLN